VRRRTIDGDGWRDTSYWYDLDLEDEAHLEEEGVVLSHNLALQYEGWFKVENYYASHYYAWFVPPATTRYRFYVQCDDDCAVKLGTTPGSVDDPTTILDVHSHTDKRWAWAEDGVSRVSEWYELTEGEHYYLEGEH
jgi:hypothetical protein